MLLIATLVLSILILWIFVSFYQGHNANFSVSIGHEPLEKLTVLYRISKRRVDFLGPLLGRSRVIVIRYANTGDAIMVHSPYYAVGIIVNNDNYETGVKNYIMSLLGYKMFVLPPSTLAVTASCPCINPALLLLVLRKMHKKLDAHIQRHRLCAYPRMEIYDGSSVKIIAPLTRQTQYYVPEVIMPPKWEWCINYNGQLSEEAEEDEYEMEEDRFTSCKTDVYNGFTNRRN